MRAHAHDLRAEVANDWDLNEDEEADRVVHLVAADWRQAPLVEADRTLCLYAEKLTLTPKQMNEADIDALRRQGFDDRAIHDASQIIGYFNYINRVADGLDVAQEDFVRPWEAK